MLILSLEALLEQNISTEYLTAAITKYQHLGIEPGCLPCINFAYIVLPCCCDIEQRAVAVCSLDVMWHVLFMHDDHRRPDSVIFDWSIPTTARI